MSRRGSKADGEIVGAIDAVPAQKPALGGQQFEAVRALRREARQLSQTGRSNDACDGVRRALSATVVDHEGRRAPVGTD